MNHSLILFAVVSCVTVIWLAKSQRRDSEQSLMLANFPPSEPSLTPSEETKLKGCFPWSVYYLQKIEYRSPAIICQGNLRYLPPDSELVHKTATELAYELIKKNIAACFGDRFLVLLQEGRPEESDEKPLVAKYFFALVPNFKPAVPFQGWSVLVPVISLLVLIMPSLTLGLWLIPIIVIREFVRHLVAKYYQVKITLPYLVGQSMGLLWYRSPIPSRKVLFDMAIAPNLITVLISFPLLIWGLAHSTPTYLGALNGISPQISVLLAGLLQIITGFNGPAIDLHPTAWIGGSGLIITAVSLIPVGILDGGHLLHSMFGQKPAAIASSVSRLLILAFSLLPQPWLLVVGVQLFLINDNPSPTLDEVTDVNGVRDILGIAMLILMLLIILPVPRFR